MLKFYSIWIQKHTQTVLSSRRLESKYDIITLVLLGLLNLISFLSMAEGSRDLYPAGTQGYRSYLIGGGAVTAAFNPFVTPGTMKVYVKAGETLYLGSSVQGMTSPNGGTTGTMNLRAPNGATYTSGNSTTNGRIVNRSQELNGPNRPGVTNGYTPYSHVVLPAEEGIWEVDFVAFGNNTNLASPGTGTHPTGTWNGNTYDGTTYNSNYAATANWVQPLSYGTNPISLIAAFDVSVGANGSSGTLIPGRLFSTVLAMVGPNTRFNDMSFYAKFHVVTPSGYTFLVNTNGKNGAAFNFFSNDKGIFKKNNAGAVILPHQPSYQSLNSSAAADLQASTWDPRKPDEGTHYTNKVFFNKPATDLPTQAAIRYAGTSSTTNTWLRNIPIEPTITDFSMSCGGLIKYKSNVEGRFQILLDVGNNGSFEDPVDVIIRGEAKAGDNTLFWDMKNGNGTYVGNNVTVRLSVMITTAEVHFPFIDVESNQNGIIIELTDFHNNYTPISGKDIVYWDDRNIEYPKDANGNTITPVLVVPPVPLFSVVTGVSSNSNGHKWHGATPTSDVGYFGNNKTLDTWTYVNTNVEGTITTCTGITGNVFNDNDNNANVNPSGTTPIPTKLYATLLNGTTPIKSVPVGSDGMFHFTQVEIGNYTVILSEDSLATIPSLPDGWANTGEDCCDNTGNDGTVDGRVSVNVPNQDPITNVNFGIKEVPVIKANDDDFGSIVSPTEAYTTPTTVFENDTLNGEPVDADEVTLKVNNNPVTTPVSLKDSEGEDVPGVTLNPDGKVTVAPNTAPGTYTLPYTICEIDNPTNCDDAEIVIRVTEPSEILAENDDFGSIVSPTEAYTTSTTVFENDTLNGEPVDADEVTLKVNNNPVTTPVSLKDSEGEDAPGVTLNPDGKVTVAPNTAPGTYTLPYTICEIDNPTNCDDAEIVIKVTEPSQILAENDDFGSIVSPTEAYTTPTTVFENDTLNEDPVDADEVTLKVNDTPVTTPVSLKDSEGEDAPGVTLNPDGKVTVAPNTAPGTYTLPYTICEIDNPTNCDDAEIVIKVTEVDVFDLALTKRVKEGSKAAFKLNDEVTYVITVINEGTIEATDVNIVDYVPAGLELVSTTWELVDGKAKLATPIERVEAGQEVSVEITFKVVSVANASIRNKAEIASAQGGIDIDSTPNNDEQGEDDMDTSEISICAKGGKCLSVKTTRKK